jgi:choline dehydrogenase-like flavoprotein
MECKQEHEVHTVNKMGKHILSLSCYISLWYRGNSLDYDGWSAAGNPGWSYEEVEKYFLKSIADTAETGLKHFF